MKFFWLLERYIVTLSFHRHDMDHDREIAILCVFENADKQRKIVAVDRTKIAKAHFLENKTAAIAAPSITAERTVARFERHFSDGALERFFSFVSETHRNIAFGQTFDPCAEILLQTVITRIGD